MLSRFQFHSDVLVILVQIQPQTLMLILEIILELFKINATSVWGVRGQIIIVSTSILALNDGIISANTVLKFQVHRLNN